MHRLSLLVTALLLCACGPSARELSELGAATVLVKESNGLTVSLEGVTNPDECRPVSSKLTADVNGHPLELTGNGGQQRNLILKWGCAPIELTSTESATALGLDLAVTTIELTDGRTTWTLSVDNLGAVRELRPRSLPDPMHPKDYARLNFTLPDEALADADVSAALRLESGEARMTASMEYGSVKVSLASLTAASQTSGTLSVTAGTFAHFRNCDGPAQCSAPVTWTFSSPLSVAP